MLYVANSADGTLTRIDAAHGRVAGPLLPAGPAPWRVAAGAGGSALVLAAVPRAVRLTFLSRRDGDWIVQPIALEAGAADALLAGDGNSVAAVAYGAGGTALGSQSRCRVALVDLRDGRIFQTRTVCGPEDSIVGLAVAGPTSMVADVQTADLAATTVYLSIWHQPRGDEACSPSSGRIEAMQLATGRTLAEVPVSGVPGSLVLAAGPGGPGGHGRRLYTVLAQPGARGQGDEACREPAYAEQFDSALRWELLGLDATGLNVLTTVGIGQPPRAVVVAEDGGRAYLLAGQRALIGVDLARSRVDLQTSLPDQSGGLAVTHNGIYVSEPFGQGVWVFDRLRGRLLRTIATGRHPLGITLLSASP